MRRLLLAGAALVLLAATAAIALGATSVGPFTFASGVAGTTFECSLDGGVYKTCSSPYSPTMAAGAHTLRVQEKFTITSSSPPPASSSNHCFASPSACGFPDPT